MRLAPHILFVALFGLSVVGCGGGGGGGNSVTFPVSTDWTSRGTSGTPTGASERIIVHPLVTPTSETTRINLDAPTSGTTTQTTNLSLASGKYVVHVDLFSGAGGSGAITGSLDAIVDTSVNTGVQIAIGKPIATISVGPESISVPVGQTQTYFAGPKASNGEYTFASPTDITFASTNTSVMTIAANSSDTTSAVGAALLTGTTTVTATAASTSVTGSVPTSVAVTSATHKKWTVMVFLNASNNLVSYAKPNFVQMQKAVQGTDTNLLVIWKESTSQGAPDFTGTRVYLVQPSQSGAISSTLVKDMGTNVDMGSWQTLGDFLTYARTNYPADHYCLDMWDHGDGWQDAARKTPAKFRGISYDDETGTHITSWQMDLALARGGFGSANKLDVLAYDACCMQMLECGYQVQNYVHYIVGSEDLTPGAGYDYSVALLPFFQNASGTPETLAHGFVDQMVNDTASGQVYNGTAVCQSVVDVTQMANVATAVNALGAALIANKTSIGTIADSVRGSAMRYDAAVYYHFYFDLYDLANRLQTSAGIPSAVATAAANVKTAVQAAVTYNRYDSLDAGSNGLAIDFSDGTDFDSGSPSYASLYDHMTLATTGAPNWYSWLTQAP